MKNERVFDDVDEVIEAIDEQHNELLSVLDSVRDFYDTWHAQVKGTIFVVFVILLALYLDRL